MGNYGKNYSLVKAAVDRRMGTENKPKPLGRWGRVKAFFNDSSFTDRRKAIIDDEINKVYNARRGCLPENVHNYN